jgi:HK97 family phage portal protein
MAWWNNLINATFNLREQDRDTIWRVFGSFRSNQLAKNQGAFINQGYESNVDVYSVIKKITDTSKSLPWVVERQSSEGWEVVNDTSLHALMEQPNRSKGLTWQDITEQALIYTLANGNAYYYGLVPEGFRSIEELDILPSQYVEPMSNGDFFNPEIIYQFILNNQKFNFTSEQIAHVSFFNPGFSTVDESLCGLSPIQVASQVVKVGNDRWDADANLLQNRGAIGLITDKSDRPMTGEEAGQVQGSFDRRAAGTDKFGKTIVTNKDLNYIQMAMSPQDLQLIEKGVINLRAMCNVYGLDSSLFNDPANKTFNNRKEAEKAMFTNAVIPLMDKFQAKMNQWLVPTHFPDQGYRMRVDYSNIPALQEDFNEKASILVNLKNSGIITANEARMEMGKPEAMDENANELVVANNLVPLSNIDPEPTQNEN